MQTAEAEAQLSAELSEADAHQKPTFHPLGDSLNPALALLE
jgi:tRNA G10  N-methylase Trm11